MRIGWTVRVWFDERENIICASQRCVVQGELCPRVDVCKVIKLNLHEQEDKNSE